MVEMKLSDVGRHVRIFDRPDSQGNGLLCTILEVYNDTSFRVLSDSGKESEYHNSRLIIQYLDGGNNEER